MLYVKYGKNQLHASEEMSFENVDSDDDGRPDGQQMPGYIIS